MPIFGLKLMFTTTNNYIQCIIELCDNVGIVRYCRVK